MNYARTRRGLVVLVTLLLGLSLVAPAAVAIGPHDDGTSGDSFGDGLSGSSSSDTNGSDGLSSDSSSESDDSLLSDSDGDSDSTSDSSGDTTSDSGTSSDSSSDSDSSDSFGSDDDSDSSDGLGSDDDSDSSDSFGSDDDSDGGAFSDSDSDDEEGVDETLLRESLPTLMPDSTVASFDEATVSDADLVDVEATTSTSGTGYEVEVLQIQSSDDPILRLTATGETTDGMATTITTVSETLGSTGDRFMAGTSGTTDATGDAARVESTEPAGEQGAPIDGGEAAIEPGAADPVTGDDTGAPRQNAIGFESPVSPDDIPGGPTGAGAMVGLLGAAAAVAARQSGALSGMAGSLGTTAQTTAAAMPGSSHLDRLVRMLAPFRYSRYDDSDPLEHDAREAMFEVVEDSPGTYLSEIADRADIPLSTARHHIRVLEREDLVSGAKVRGKRRFYPAHTEGVELAAAMNDDSTAAVIDALARLGAASVSDLADELDKDPSTVTHHVQRLEEDEVVVRERDGRAVMNKLTAAARTMLEPEEVPAESPTAGEAMASD